MRYAWLIGVGALAAALAGCQGGQVAAPASGPAATRPAAQVPPGAAGAGVALAGRLTVEDHGASVTFEPFRAGAAVGDDFALDATAFFTADPCTDCMAITGYGLRPDLDVLELAVTIRHPFPSTTNRRDLDVFDPRVILVTSSEDEWEFTTFEAAGTYPRPTDSGDYVDTALSANVRSVLNADGHTTHFDERADALAGRILGGTLNPYKDYARELIPNDPASGPNPNHRMSQGRSPETQVFQVYLPPTLDRFDAVLLLEVNYGQSATRATRLSPIYYLPQFNRKEAYRIETALPGVSDGRRYGSNLTLSVLVEDWQQIAALDVNYPNASDTSGLRAPSSVVDVEVYAPGWNRTGVVETIAVGGLGTASSPLIYNMNVPRDAVLPPNPGASVPVLIKVDDQLDGTVISNTDPAFDLGHTRDVSAYKILEFQPTGSSQLLPASPQLLLHDTGLAIRPAPYAGSFEGTGGVEPFYTSGASTVFAGDHDDLRLLMAPASAANDLIAYDPLATESMSYAAGVRPYDDYPNSPQAHPNPAVPMPVFSLAATPGGNAIAGFGDDNFTINPLRFSTGLTDPVPNSAVTALWRWDGAVGTLGPRLSDGCGSAPGPSLGGKVRLALANDNNVTIGRWSNLLGWASAGMNSEACGTYARVDYYGTPYTSGADRFLTMDITTVINTLLGGTVNENGYRTVARLVAGRHSGGTAEWPHYVTNGTTILRFNGFEAYDQPTRTSRPVASSTVMTLPVGQIVGMVYVPLEGAPFVVGGTQQTTDWLVVLTRDTAGYALRALDANAPWTEVASENGTIEGWGSLFPLIVDIDFDPVSRLLMLSYDSNGITSGGSILVTALTPQ